MEGGRGEGGGQILETPFQGLTPKYMYVPRRHIIGATRGVTISKSASLACRLEITVPVGWALNTNN